jgi:hypothetical protein
MKGPLEFLSAHGSCVAWKYYFELLVECSHISMFLKDFFLTTGFICTDHRGRLAPSTVNMLASMNSWLRDELGYNRSKRQLTSAVSSARFTTINLELALKSGMEAQDEQSDDDIED